MTIRSPKLEQVMTKWVQGVPGELPEAVPQAFLKDCIEFARLHYVLEEPAVKGQHLQEQMVRRYPESWMLWLFHKIGVFSYGENTPHERQER